MRTKVGKNGVFIPRDLLPGITEVEIRKQNGMILVIPAGKDDRISENGEEIAAQQPQFDSARDLIKNSDDFAVPLRSDDPIFDIGREPVACGIPDASENLDKYLYGGE
jgi:hypothetical protein